jgi:hypothetical protein
MENSNSEIVKNFLKNIYKKSSSKEINKLKKDIESIFFKNLKKKPENNLWNETDFFLISYADSVIKKNQKNLKTLNFFLDKYCEDFNFVHILPFFHLLLMMVLQLLIIRK